MPSEGPEAYYLPRGNGRYEPTWATESPWDRKAQHGGPPAALLAHVIDQAVEGPLRISRISVDILGPIPLREAVVEVSPVKPGRRVQLTEARMMVDGRVAVTARTWHIATGDRPPTTSEEQTAPPPVPPRPTPQHFYPGLDDWGYGRSIEWRFTRGSFDSLGAADVWARVRLPLVDGVALTGQDRVLIAADSANGLSLSLPLKQWFSIPPTMTATLLRPPTGEWVHLACRTYLLTMAWDSPTPTCSTRTGSSVRSPSRCSCRSASQTTVSPDRVNTPVCVGHCSRVQSELANGHPLDLGSAG